MSAASPTPYEMWQDVASLNFLVCERRPFAAQHLRQFCFPACPEREQLRRRIGFNREDDVILHLFGDLGPFDRRMNRLNKLLDPLA